MAPRGKWQRSERNSVGAVYGQGLPWLICLFGQIAPNAVSSRWLPQRGRRDGFIFWRRSSALIPGQPGGTLGWARRIDG